MSKVGPDIIYKLRHLLRRMVCLIINKSQRQSIAKGPHKDNALARQHLDAHPSMTDLEPPLQGYILARKVLFHDARAANVDVAGWLHRRWK
ncbi:hypothetical protein ETB97_004468 [Aspergillus alliaceus]|uniref:Uncharacterized protein n=1 Tax=Petromyces alliaceus TaxID=209559 RepID=A0A8H6E4Q1_PETAA|nr:hypothetical protein ETB97_004468 [Aspergillus burnettii]